MASTEAAAPAISLSADEARLLTLRAQGLVGTQARRGGVPAMLRRVGAVQLDTISVLARSHELVAYARLGAVPRTRIERAYWDPGAPATFEYWSHAACILPAEEWPYYAFRRRALRARLMRWHETNEKVVAQVLARLKAEGPLTATQLGGAKKGGPWWDWSETKIAVERLLDTGEVICAQRTGWRRVYDLPERVLDDGLLGHDPSDEDCVIRLIGTAGRALGVATRADLLEYQRVRQWGVQTMSTVAATNEIAVAAGLVPVSVGHAAAAVPAWADPEALAWLDSTSNGGNGTTSRGRHRVTLLSPFDSLIWDRKRTLRMFGFEHTLEAYVPQPKRVHGYYTMPLLARGRLLGRVDPARDGRTLVARQLSLDTAAAAGPMARALREAASWVGCDDVALGRVSPPGLTSRLEAALRQEPAD
jgi:uncharacterized protein YcaQ